MTMAETTNTAHELTATEIRDLFLTTIIEYVEDWGEHSEKTTREKLSGLAFSILAIIDGEAGDLPAFVLAPDQTTGDKAYRHKRGQNWYPEGQCDIAGSLHDEFARLRDERWGPDWRKGE